MLGIIQGLTEFLPVSSSGHLVIGQNYLGLHEPELLFDVAVHFGTFVAGIVFFKREVIELIKGFFKPKSEYGRIAWLIILGTIPAVLAGFFFEDYIEWYFGSPKTAAFMLIVTGILLSLTYFAASGNVKMKNIKWRTALLIGIAQACAIMPGLSRSGSTISTALFLKTDKSDAARFSFLLSLPAIFGAVIWEGRHAVKTPAGELIPIIAGVVTAALTGYFAIAIMIKIVGKGRLYYFAPYCFIIAVLALFNM